MLRGLATSPQFPILISTIKITKAVAVGTYLGVARQIRVAVRIGAAPNESSFRETSVELPFFSFVLCSSFPFCLLSALTSSRSHLPYVRLTYMLRGADCNLPGNELCCLDLATSPRRGGRKNAVDL